MLRVLITLCFLSSITWAIKPSGYFLVLKIQDGHDNDRASMFEVGFDGSIKQWWNQSVGSLSGSGAFAFDNESKTVYLPTVNQSTAVSRNGKVAIQKVSSNQVFWSYNYEAQSDHLVGVCSDSNRQQWRWCEIDIQTGRLSINPNQLPYTDGPNGLDAYEPLYTFDFRQQLIWYKPYIQPFLVAANYRTGKISFTSGETGASCIAHNPSTGKTYILKGYDVSQYTQLAVFELLPKPSLPKEILKLSNDGSVIISVFGLCRMIPQANAMYVFMTNVSVSFDNLMPTDLFLIDLSEQSYEQIPLDYKNWKDEEIISGFQYVSS